MILIKHLSQTQNQNIAFYLKGFKSHSSNTVFGVKCFFLVEVIVKCGRLVLC